MLEMETRPVSTVKNLDRVQSEEMTVCTRALAIDSDSTGSRSRIRQIEVFGLICFCLFSLMVPLSGLFLFFQEAIVRWLDWKQEGPKGQLWFALLPQIGVLFGASIGGWLWARTWLQKQATLETQNKAIVLQENALQHQQRSLAEAQDQFNQTIKKDQHQFGRRMLEERFNRVLDDFSSQDPAMRAGASSRLAAMAQEPSPSTTGSHYLSVEHYPFYMPSIRQLVQRLSMETDVQVSDAISEALKEVSVWTNRTVSLSNKEDRSEPDIVQAEYVHFLARANRASLDKLIDHMAMCLVAFEVPVPTATDTEGGMELESTITADIWNMLSLHLSWSTSPERLQRLARFVLSDSALHNAMRLYLSEDHDKKESLKRLKVAGTVVKRLGDTLSYALSQLAAPVDYPSEIRDGFERTGTELKWARFPRIDVSETFLVGGSFGDANLQDIRFEAAWLENAHFYRCNLDGCDFSVTTLSHASISSSRARCAHFESAEMNSTIIYDCSLDGSYFEGCDWSQGVVLDTLLEDCILEKIDFQDTRLAADFKGAFLKDINFKGAFIGESDFLLANQLPESILEGSFKERQYDAEAKVFVESDKPVSEESAAKQKAIREKLQDQKRVKKLYSSRALPPARRRGLLT